MRYPPQYLRSSRGGVIATTSIGQVRQTKAGVIIVGNDDQLLDIIECSPERALAICDELAAKLHAAANGRPIGRMSWEAKTESD